MKTKSGINKWVKKYDLTLDKTKEYDITPEKIISYYTAHLFNQKLKDLYLNFNSSDSIADSINQINEK